MDWSWVLVSPAEAGPCWSKFLRLLPGLGQVQPLFQLDYAELLSSHCCLFCIGLVTTFTLLSLDQAGCFLSLAACALLQRSPAEASYVLLLHTPVNWFSLLSVDILVWSTASPLLLLVL